MKKHYNTGKNNGSYKNGIYCKNRINHCIDCGKKISPLAKRCLSCAKKGPKNGMFGKQRNLSKLTKKKMRENHANFNSEKNPNWKGGRTNKIYYCIESNCNNIASGPNRRCIQCSNKGVHNARFGKTIKPNWIKYNGIWMRSSYEIKFAYFLDCSAIKWLYKSKTFDLGNTTYTPDFYIPEWDLYIEIKGYFSDKAKKKINLFKKLYPKVKTKILMYKDL